MALDGFAVDLESLPSKLGRNAPGTVKGKFGIYFVNAVFYGYFFWGRGHWVVVQARAV
jgi:hypothetical protein